MTYEVGKDAHVLKQAARILLILVALGCCIFAFEHWGDQYMTRLSDYVADHGRTGIIIFVAVNALATMFLIPQAIFTVAAGALFGWKFGSAWASLAMTIGAVGSFFVARYGVRDWLRVKFHENEVFQKMLRLSKSHPLHVISLSRIIPIIPFPVASYLLGVTEVRSLPYALLTWMCMLPETLFLASGGHLLSSGISGDKGTIEAGVVLGVAGVILAVVIHRMKKKFLEEGED